MSRHKHRGERLPPFVPVSRDMLRAPAWRAMSLGARVLYIALKHHLYNNGHVYLSHRKAAEEIGSKTIYIGRWFRELQHYGFIVMTNPGGLGVDGKGKAPHWRLTEGNCFGERATRDYERWDGTKFKDRPKKQKPVPQKGDAVSPKRHTGLSLKRETLNGTTVSQKGDICAPHPVSQKGDITRLATGVRPR